MEKIKIIDLLNKIANGEEVPKKIKFNEDIYTYHDKEHGYCKHHYDNTYICINSEYYLFDILNDEVEIIEENNKINNINLRYVLCESDINNKNIIDVINDFFEENDEIINKLIDEINKLKEGK